MLSTTPAFASTPQTVVIPDAGGKRSGTWKKVSWYPQPYNSKPGEATYLRLTRRGGNIATVETLNRLQDINKPGNFNYAIFIDKYDCANDTYDSIIEVVISPQKGKSVNEIYWDRRVNRMAKPITINGIRHWWNPRPAGDRKKFEMEPP